MPKLPMHKTGNKAYAFFDVDDTLISNKSMFSFMDLYFSHYPNTTLQEEFNDEIQRLIKENTPWEIANKIYYSYFKHFTISQVKEVCALWFKKCTVNKQHFYHKNVTSALAKHQSAGIECVFVSGSFIELLEPIALDLGVKDILAIKLAKNGSKYTGEIIPPQTIGKGKAQAIRDFITENNASADASFAYGDDISDVPMLEMVGNPVAVSGGRKLVEHAQHVGWQVIQPN